MELKPALNSRTNDSIPISLPLQRGCCSMGIQHQANPKPLSLTNRLEENGNVPAADAQGCDSRSCLWPLLSQELFWWPYQTSDGSTRLTSHKEAKRLNSLMMMKYSDIWREVLFNYWPAKGKPLFPNLSCSNLY